MNFHSKMENEMSLAPLIYEINFFGVTHPPIEERVAKLRQLSY